MSGSRLGAHNRGRRASLSPTRGAGRLGVGTRKVYCGADRCTYEAVPVADSEILLLVEFRNLCVVESDLGEASHSFKLVVDLVECR